MCFFVWPTRNNAMMFIAVCVPRKEQIQVSHGYHVNLRHKRTRCITAMIVPRRKGRELPQHHDHHVSALQNVCRTCAAHVDARTYSTTHHVCIPWSEALRDAFSLQKQYVILNSCRGVVNAPHIPADAALPAANHAAKNSWKIVHL